MILHATEDDLSQPCWSRVEAPLGTLLSCISHCPWPPVPCLSYLTTDLSTQLRRLASCVAELLRGLWTAAFNGTLTLASGSSHSLWILIDGVMSPGVQSLTMAHSSSEGEVMVYQLHWSSLTAARCLASRLTRIQTGIMIYGMLSGYSSDCIIVLITAIPVR